MRVVVDTNVVVSALLGPGRVPDRALAALCARGGTLLYDARILAEYHAVLARPKFRGVDPLRREALLATLLGAGTEVIDAPAWAGELADPDDRMFVEVARAGRAEVLLTGNLRDYREGLGFEVLPPATLLARLELAC